MSTLQLILASASPRRRDLLDQLGVSYQVDPADIDETPRDREAAGDYVERMAREKAACVAQRHDMLDCVVLAADTTVVIDEDILGKPTDHFDGLGILARLSGRRHRVITAVCLQTRQSVEVRQVETGVNFVQLDRAVCEAYLATSEPWDKAGAYAIQGLGGAFVSSIDGSYSNVVGLPLTETWRLLSASGIATALEREHE
ncbi:MAG: Maf family protein [Halioglobus sp.]